MSPGVLQGVHTRFTYVFMLSQLALLDTNMSLGFRRSHSDNPGEAYGSESAKVRHY